MTKQNDTRQLWRQGDSIAEIARKTGVTRHRVQIPRQGGLQPRTAYQEGPPVEARSVQAAD